MLLLKRLLAPSSDSGCPHPALPLQAGDAKAAAPLRQLYGAWRQAYQPGAWRRDAAADSNGEARFPAWAANLQTVLSVNAAGLPYKVGGRAGGAGGRAGSGRAGGRAVLPPAGWLQAGAAALAAAFPAQCGLRLRLRLHLRLRLRCC